MSENSSDLIIRPLRFWEVRDLLWFQVENDYEALSAHPREPESPLYSILKLIWHRKRLTTFVAVRDEQILGYISLVFGKSKKFRGNTYLVSAAVKEGQRGQGIGTRLFSMMEAYARERGAHRVEFEVFSKNVKARKLYKRLGYQIEGVKRRAVQNGSDYDDLIFMAKFLDEVPS